MNLYVLLALFGIVFLRANLSFAYNSLDQGYVSDEPNLLNCGSACIGAPEIKTIIDSGYEIERSGLYVEQGNINYDNQVLRAPWSESRTKWLRKFGRSLHRNNKRYSASAFRIGVGIQDRGRSATSAIWLEIRKPILYDIRNRIVDSYKLRQREKNKGKLKVWAVEQSIDIGASALGLDSSGYNSEILDSDQFIHRKSSVVTSFKPRLDPYKGRYGAKLQAKFYRGARDPFFFEASYFYCNSDWGIGDRICSYLHQVQTTYGYRYRAHLRDISFQLTVFWEGKSLNPDAYVVDGEPYDFSPWGFQSRISIAI